MVLNSDRIREYLDAVYRVEDNRLVLLVVESCVQADNFVSEKQRVPCNIQVVSRLPEPKT